MSILSKMRDLFAPDADSLNVDGTPRVSVDDLAAFGGQTSFDNWQHSIWDGSKFDGGFGATQLQALDYQTMRARSAQLFRENHYARGILRRLVTNVINTGLTPEACPDEDILGLPADSLDDWTETTENRFLLWGKTPSVCDFKKKNTFGALQRMAYLEAMIEGDILVSIRQDPRTRLPMIQLTKGSAIQTPLAGDLSRLRKGHEVVHGVELDAIGRQVAFYVRQKDGSYKRVPAVGEKSGRRIAWLVYGNDKRVDDVRGEPLLSVILQSLKEIDRYRDSAQRQAAINSILAMFIKKTADKPSTLPMTGGAIRRDEATVTDNTTGGTPRKTTIGNYLPGMILEELQVGEEPVTRGGEGTDINFGGFEEVLVASMAWSLEIPPEILRLSFSNNYSASQAAINEVKMTINLKWGDFGETFCDPIYSDWLLSETLNGNNPRTEILDAWRDPMQHDKFASWTSANWYGAIKPSTDTVKQAKGSKILVEEGWSTNARESRVTTGTKFSKNIKRLKRENEIKAEAMRPLLELKQEFGSESTQEAIEEVESRLQEVTDEWA